MLGICMHIGSLKGGQAIIFENGLLKSEGSLEYSYILALLKQAFKTL